MEETRLKSSGSGGSSRRRSSTPDDKLELYFLVFFPDDGTNDVVKVGGAAWPPGRYSLHEKLSLDARQCVRLVYGGAEYEARVLAKGESYPKMLRMQDRLVERSASGEFDVSGDLSFLDPAAASPMCAPPNGSISSSRLGPVGSEGAAAADEGSPAGGSSCQGQPSDGVTPHSSPAAPSQPKKKRQTPPPPPQSMQKRGVTWEGGELVELLQRLNENLEANTRALCGLRAEVKQQGASAVGSVHPDSHFDAGFIKAMQLFGQHRSRPRANSSSG